MSNLRQRGVNISFKKKNGATRIEVDTEHFNSDPIYDDVTLDTEMDRYYVNSFKKMFNIS